MSDKSEVVCSTCVVEPFLASRIKRKGIKSVCCLCGATRRCISLKGLADDVELILSDHICVAESQSHRYGYQYSGDDLDYWVGEIFQCDNDVPIVRAICRELVKHNGSRHRRFSDDDTYVRLPAMPIDAETDWINFTDGLKHGARFFNHDAQNFLKWLFKDVDRYGSLKGSRVIQTLLPSGKPIYRARLSNSDDDLNPIIKAPREKLSAPPKEKARSGRMNPEGVPAFYGSFERNTCVAELRPPVGGTVVSGKFKVTRSLRVLNFHYLENAYLGPHPSYFDSTFRTNFARREILRALHQKITTPVLPGQESNYLVTQVIAEYLARQHSQRFDGIIFRSAQRKNGNNVVLFAHAISTDPIPDEDGFWDPKPVEPGIQYVPESLRLHDIQGVRFTAPSQKIQDGHMPKPKVEHEEWDW
ncbi:RES family NAD+ phosphorylase [Pseudomonas sp. M20]|uniref:RES family NAD+ phosphorylase n=1 Tax=Pseudomonas sp. M20 TaxID=3379129 RepID=UPI00386FFC72